MMNVPSCHLFCLSDEDKRVIGHNLPRNRWKTSRSLTGLHLGKQHLSTFPDELILEVRFKTGKIKSALANNIGKYFVQKISWLRQELDQGYVPNDQSYVLDDRGVNSDSTISPTCIEAFELLAEDDVRVLIANSRSTSCCLDPIPTHLLKSCSE